MNRGLNVETRTPTLHIIRMRVRHACPRCRGEIEIRKERQEPMTAECTLCYLRLKVSRKKFMEFLTLKWEQ